MKFMPSTGLGKWSVYLIIESIVSIILVTVFASTVYADIQYVETGIIGEFQNRPLMPIFGVLSILSGISAFILGLLAIFKKKDRSIAVIIATILGGIMLIFVVGEFVGPE